MSFWSKMFGGARKERTSVDPLFQENVIYAMKMSMTLNQYRPPPPMLHVSYEDQAADLLIAALRGDTKAQHIFIEMIAEFPERLLAEPVNEVAMRQLMQRALTGDQAVQRQVAALLQTLVPKEPQVPAAQPLTYAVLSGNLASQEFTSWDEALTFARALAKQSPNADITIHPQGTSDRVFYRVLASGEVEKIDLKKYI